MSGADRLAFLQKALDHIDGADRLGCLRAIGKLTDVIDEQESLISGVPGLLKDVGMGLLLLTDRRLAFVHTGVIWGMQVVDFPHRAVSSIESSTGLIFGEVKVTASGAEQRIEKIPKRYVADFVLKAREAWIPAGATTKAGTPTVGASTSSLTDAIGKLIEMKVAGHLSEDEFQTAKFKLLQTHA